MRTRCATAIGLLLLLAACSSTTRPKGQLLDISANGSVITLQNRNEWPVFYLAADPEFLALADFILCSDPASSCPRVPPKGTVRVPYGDIAGFHAGQTHVVVWQWRLERQADGTYSQVGFQAVTVPLRFPLVQATKLGR